MAARSRRPRAIVSHDCLPDALPTLFLVRYVMIVARELFGESMLPLIQERPPFPADHVGSLLRPTALRPAFRQHAAGEITDDAFAAVQARCIRDALALQEQTGLQV